MPGQMRSCSFRRLATWKDAPIIFPFTGRSAAGPRKAPPRPTPTTVQRLACRPARFPIDFSFVGFSIVCYELIPHDSPSVTPLSLSPLNYVLLRQINHPPCPHFLFISQKLSDQFIASPQRPNNSNQTLNVKLQYVRASKSVTLVKTCVRGKLSSMRGKLTHTHTHIQIYVDQCVMSCFTHLIRKLFCRYICSFVITNW